MTARKAKHAKPSEAYPLRIPASQQTRDELEEVAAELGGLKLYRALAVVVRGFRRLPPAVQHEVVREVSAV